MYPPKNFAEVLRKSILQNADRLLLLKQGPDPGSRVRVQGRGPESGSRVRVQGPGPGSGYRFKK